MNIRDKQYHDFFTKMGYEFIYFGDKNSFRIKDIGYCKVTDSPAPQTIVELAKKHSHKERVILLEGNLTFKVYPEYMDGKFVTDNIFIPKDQKYYPLFFNSEFLLDCFPEVTNIIAISIKGEDIVCQRCGSINDFEITKPSIHYKCTCLACGFFITNISENKPVIMPFGKYEGREIKSLTSDEELRYLQWLVTSSDKIKGRLKDAIQNQLSL